MTAPRITAAICTFNRYDTLAAAIESLTQQSLPSGDFEILVIDNSPDHEQSADMAKDYGAISNLKWHIETTAGLSNARNVATKNAQAPLIAFMDDDAIAARDWLETLVSVFAAFGPQAKVMGGRVDPIWGVPQPSWLPDSLLGNVSVVNWGGSDRFAAKGEWVAGTNIAFRVDALKAVGGFAVHLGRTRGGQALLSNDETDVIERMTATGAKLVYSPRAGRRASRAGGAADAGLVPPQGRLAGGVGLPSGFPGRLRQGAELLARGDRVLRAPAAQIPHAARPLCGSDGSGDVPSADVRALQFHRRPAQRLSQPEREPGRMNSAEPAKIWAGARIAVLSPTPTHPQDSATASASSASAAAMRRRARGSPSSTIPPSSNGASRSRFRADRAMSGAWAQYHIVPPTRLLHENPAGNYHSIDEWWDVAIGQFLTWLFSVESFDIFIVNYSWLSKALEFAPASTFKILDTHDKFSGRREMLESLGLQPEFFYTTEAQEKIALGRADLVWAIKREEAAQLQELSQSPVLALPHLDPFCALRRAEPDAEGILRVGVIGARNNVNRMNIAAFLEEAEPIFRDAFAPVKVVIAGSVCDLLEDIESPFVELLGSVENVEDFYRVVDCVAVPMLRSTGLKIKTGEALSLGLPVISLAHAFEGYEPASPLHGLTDFAEMARAIVDLGFAPRSALDALAVASAQAHRKTAASIAKAYRRSDALALENRRLIVMAVDSRSLVSGSVFNLVLKSVHEALRESAAIAILVVRGQVTGHTGQCRSGGPLPARDRRGRPLRYTGAARRIVGNRRRHVRCGALSGRRASRGADRRRAASGAGGGGACGLYRRHSPGD